MTPAEHEADVRRTQYEALKIQHSMPIHIDPHYPRQSQTTQQLLN